MIFDWLVQRSELVQELRDQVEILREEQKALYERIINMASSIPHVRVAINEQSDILAHSPMELLDEEGVRVGNKGANVV